MKTMLHLIVLVSFTGYSQTIEKFYDYNWKETNNLQQARFYSVIKKTDSLWVDYDYFIFEKTVQMVGYYKDSSQKIRQGEFKWFYSNGFLQTQGRFENNKRSGLWIGYHQNGNMSDSAFYLDGKPIGVSMAWHDNGYPADSSFHYADGSGMTIQWFDNGNPSVAGLLATGDKKNGKWKFFHKNGNLSALEIYDNGNLVSKEYFDENGTIQKDTTNRDHDLEFPGGGPAWKKYMEKHVNWPANLTFKTSGQAVVMVRFAVDEEGNVSEVYVTLPFHPAFDKIALDAIRKSPKWIPAVSHNRKIKSYRTQPVTFALVDD